MKYVIWLLVPAFAMELTAHSLLSVSPEETVALSVEFTDSDAKQRIQEWVTWKNRVERWDFHFNSLPRRLAPELSKYSEGLYMRGLPYYILAVVYAVSLAVYLVVRLRFRIWGGQAVKADYFTSVRRCAPGVLCAIGFCIFVSGGTVLLVASQHAHICVQTGLESTTDTALLTSSVLIHLKQALVTVNMQHISDSPRFKVETGFLTSPIEDSIGILKDAEEMEYTVQQWERKRVVLTLVLFSLGAVLSLIALLGFLLKVESLMFCFGISIGILGMFSTLLCGFYLSEITASSDFCEAVLTCVYDSSIPSKGTGFGLFFRDFNSTNRLALLEGKHALETARNNALIVLNERLEVLYGEEPVGNTQEIIEERRDAETNRWGKTVSVVETALEDLSLYQRSSHVKNYCREVETEVCDSLMDDLYLGFAGLLILSAGCGLSLCGGFSAPRIIEKWRKEDQQKQLGKYNLYGM